MGGPPRPTMTSRRASRYVAFNSITDNPKWGDERNFVLIREAGMGTYANEIELAVGKSYEVITYFHNNAVSSLNVGEGLGIARDVRLSVQAPSVLTPGVKGVISSTISSSNADPLKVWDEAYVTTTVDVQLRYLDASARIASAGAVGGRVLSTSLFDRSGTYLGYGELNGILPGCADFAGYVTYQLGVEAVHTERAADDSSDDYLATPQRKAQALLEQRDFAGALTAFATLRKLRARREGAESLTYLSNLRSEIVCLRELNRARDTLPLIEELSATRDRVLGHTHPDSLQAKRWWAWSAQQANDHAKTANIQIEIADALYSAGDVRGAEEAMATAIYYENEALNGAGDATLEVVERTAATRNGEKLKTIAKRVGVGALAASATAAIDGAVGQLFN